MAERRTPGSAVTVGTFDGVHRGHQALLAVTRTVARERGLGSVALTFDRPPQNYLGRPKPLILPLEAKRRELERYVDRVIVLDFPEVRELSPLEFARRILVDRLQARAVVSGQGFRFGRDRRGDVHALEALGRELGFDVETVEPIEIEGQGGRISSSAVREAVRSGDVDRARQLLGRYPQVFGEVVPGSGEGRRLGFPTANLSLNPEILLPAEGIYAAWVRRVEGDVRRPGAFYLGRRPTFGDGQGQPSAEAHILEQAEQEVPELYGETMEIQLLRYLRADRRFDSVEALRRQIEDDVRAVRSFFGQPVEERE